MLHFYQRVPEFELVDLLYFNHLLPQLRGNMEYLSNRPVAFETE